MPSTFITVALVEDDPETHCRLTSALAKDSKIQLLYSANAAAPMLAWLQAQDQPKTPSVLLVDLGLPDMSGLEVIRQCKAMKPGTDVMVITMFGDEANMIRAFEAGATGYLLKDGDESELAQHVQTLHAGGSPMSPIIARQLLSRMGRAATPIAPPPPQAFVAVSSKTGSQKLLLTDREEKVLQYLARGYSYTELGQLMGVTINTIQTHIRGLYAKLEVHSKSEAIFEAKQMGLLDR